MNSFAPPLVLPLVAADQSSSAIVGWDAIDKWATANVERWCTITDGCECADLSLQDRACSLAVGILGEFLSTKMELERYQRTFGPFLVDLPPFEKGVIETPPLASP